MGGVRARAGGFLAAVLLASGCSGSGDGEGEATTSSAATSSSSSGTSTTAACDAELDVVEEGFTVVPDEGMGPRISVGLVVENPGDLLATDTRLEITARDGSGDPVPAKGAETDDPALGATIEAVPPGGRQGHSFVTYLESGDVESIEVTVRRTSWAVMDEESEQVETKGASLTGERVTYTAEPAGDEPVEGASTYVLFRSSSGELIGGSSAGDGPDSYSARSTERTMDVGERTRTPLPEGAEDVAVHVDHVDPRAEPADCP